MRSLVTVRHIFGTGSKIYCLPTKLQGNIPKQHHMFDNKGWLEEWDEKNEEFEGCHPGGFVSKIGRTEGQSFTLHARRDIRGAAPSFQHCKKGLRAICDDGHIMFVIIATEDRWLNSVTSGTYSTRFHKNKVWWKGGQPECNLDQQHAYISLVP